MHRSVLYLLRGGLLLAVALLQFGCASTDAAAGGANNSNDPSTDLAPVPSHDDSHGWGTSVGGM